MPSKEDKKLQSTLRLLNDNKNKLNVTKDTSKCVAFMEEDSFDHSDKIDAIKMINHFLFSIKQSYGVANDAMI